MGLQHVLSIFGRTLSDRPLSSAWRMTGNPEDIPGQKSAWRKRAVECREPAEVSAKPVSG
jgi:hypothetical protein